MIHRLPKLLYEFHELAGFLDPQEFRMNYLEIHKGFIDNLNKTLNKYPIYQQYSVADLMIRIQCLPRNLRNDVKKFGGMHFNYSLFWRILTSDKRGTPSGMLKKVISDTYNNFGEFKQEFTNTALEEIHDTNAWCWLIVKNGKLEIIKTYGWECPISKKMSPILCLKLWRVSPIFTKKQKEYVNNFWNFVNWEEVESRYLEAIF